LDQRSTEKSAGAGTTVISSAEQNPLSSGNFEARTTFVILVVDTRVAARRRVADSIRRAGYEVIEAASFDEAKRSLIARRPALVISSVRLAAFNGLHLVHLGRLAQPKLGAIIFSSGADAMLQVEAERVGASILQEPVPTATLLSLIDRMLDQDPDSSSDLRLADRRSGERRGQAEMAFVPERRMSERRAPTSRLPK
jgi:DNA-binding NtrC family response regulator